MNRSKIEWCDHTWNPITGCRGSCHYCYARTMTKRFAGDVRLNLMAKKDFRTQEARGGGGDVYVLDKPMLNETGKALVYPFGFEPTLHLYRMDALDKLKMGSNIFVGAMSDVFGDWVPDDWIDKIMDACLGRPRHNYLFLTKNAGRYCEYDVPTGHENMWYGASITRAVEMSRAELLPEGCRAFVSMEPILEDLQPEWHNNLFRKVDWIILGAETGRRKEKVVPEFGWINKIVLSADKNGVPVFMKDSLIPVVREENMRRDFPDQLRAQTASPKVIKRLYAACSECGARLKKSEMITLLARSQRGEQPKQFGFMCKGCFRKLCEKLGIDVPELAGLAESVDIGHGKDGADGEKNMEP